MRHVKTTTEDFILRFRCIFNVNNITTIPRLETIYEFCKIYEDWLLWSVHSIEGRVKMFASSLASSASAYVGLACIILVVRHACKPF